MSINTLNTRDLETRRAELEDELDTLITGIPDDINDEDYLDAAETLANWLGVVEHDHLEFIGNQVWDQGQEHLLYRWVTSNSDEGTELKNLTELEGEIPGWNSGVTLIDESDFEEYAQEYASDIGIKDLNSWPHEHIDWAAAAEALARDYESVVYDGTSYLHRS